MIKTAHRIAPRTNIILILSIVEPSRDVELEILTKIDGVIDPEYGLTTAPKSLSLLKSIDAGSNCSSVCHYKGYTYVGQENGAVDRIDMNYQIQASFIKMDSYVGGIIVYEDNIYLLVFSGTPVVHVRDMEGKEVRKWNHSDAGSSQGPNRPAIVGGELIIPSRNNCKLSKYSLTGIKLADAACTITANSRVAACDDSSDSVILLSGDKGVTKMNMNPEGEVWLETSVPNALAITCYRSHYVIVANADSKIQVLSMTTGEIISLPSVEL